MLDKDPARTHSGGARGRHMPRRRREGTTAELRKTWPGSKSAPRGVDGCGRDVHKCKARQSAHTHRWFSLRMRTRSRSMCAPRPRFLGFTVMPWELPVSMGASRPPCFKARSRPTGAPRMSGSGPSPSLLSPPSPAPPPPHTGAPTMTPYTDTTAHGQPSWTQPRCSHTMTLCESRRRRQLEGHTAHSRTAPPGLG
jgi:hypothetical protein